MSLWKKHVFYDKKKTSNLKQSKSIKRKNSIGNLKQDKMNLKKLTHPSLNEIHVNK